LSIFVAFVRFCLNAFEKRNGVGLQEAQCTKLRDWRFLFLGLLRFFAAELSSSFHLCSPVVKASGTAPGLFAAECKIPVPALADCIKSLPAPWNPDVLGVPGLKNHRFFVGTFQAE
jgi:hypothetical protein